MQSLVNGYGADYMAGFNAANKIDTFAFMPIQSISNAVTTYTGQNIGAGRIDRVHKGTLAGASVSIIICILALIIIPLGPFMLGLFNSEPEVIDSGMIYLNNVMPFYVLLSAVFILNAVERGAGESVIPMVSSLASIWLGRIPSAYYIAAKFGKEYLFYSYPAGWILGLAITGSHYISGKWKIKSQKLLEN